MANALDDAFTALEAELADTPSLMDSLEMAWDGVLAQLEALKAQVPKTSADQITNVINTIKAHEARLIAATLKGTPAEPTPTPEPPPAE